MRKSVYIILYINTFNLKISKLYGHYLRNFKGKLFDFNKIVLLQFFFNFLVIFFFFYTFIDEIKLKRKSKNHLFKILARCNFLLKIGAV